MFFYFLFLTQSYDLFYFFVVKTTRWFFLNQKYLKTRDIIIEILFLGQVLP
jgi:hypothetical protein